MKTNGLLGLLGILTLAMPAASAHADGVPPIELKGSVKVARVVTENGQQRRVLTEPEVVVPGERLVFSTAYHNSGGTQVKDFVVTNPIPEGVMLAPEDTGSTEVSVDGGKSWGKLAVLTMADGQGGRRPAQASDVTHLRWTLATLAPGAQGTLTYNAIVR